MPGLGNVATMPPPVGGWDTRNALADMPQENAVVLDNWFPATDIVSVRRGHVSHATGMPGAVDTLMTYVPPSGLQQMFAASGTGIYNVTTAGAVGAAVVTGRTSAQFQHVQIGTSGGNFLICVNGTETPQIYDGSAWANVSFTGPTLTAVRWINLHQRRLWFGEAGSLRAWYLPVNAIAGAATAFDLGAIARLGGFIVGMATWSRDGGSGAADVAVFLTSEGEAILYEGIDPASTATWGIIGVFRIGKPLGLRPFVKAGADVIVLTTEGFLPLSTALSVDRTQSELTAVSAQINAAVVASARDYFANFGWQGMLYPAGQMLIVNVPTASTTADQYVFNTITRAPCRFRGLNARCWGMVNNQPFFGGQGGIVYRFDTGSSDNGLAISAEALQAFSYFGSAATMKSFKRCEVVTLSSQPPSLAVDLALDFDVTAPLPTMFPNAPPAAGIWNTAIWDGDTWGGDTIYRGWRGVRGLARAAAVRVRTASTSATPQWSATNVLYVPGGRV